MVTVAPDHIQTHHTPVDDRSARRRDLYLIMQRTSMPPTRLEPAIPASERQQTYALDRAAIGNGDMII